MNSSFGKPQHNRVILPSPVVRKHGSWGTIMYIIGKAGARQMLEKYLLPDGRWNLLVWHGKILAWPLVALSLFADVGVDPFSVPSLDGKY